MKLLEHILLALDLNAPTRSLTSAAAALAKKYSSRVSLITCHEHAHLFDAKRGDSPGFLEERLSDVANELAAAGVEVAKKHVSAGAPFHEISALASQLDVNLVVIGAKTHEHRESVGATAERVMRHCEKPVLTIPGDAPFEIGVVLCPVDLSAVSKRGLANATHLARSFEAELCVITVIPDGLDDEHREQWAKDFENLLDGVDFNGITHTQRIEHGRASEHIVAVAREIWADLLVMGSEGRTGLPYLFLGSTAVKVAREMPCAMITLKHQDVLVARIEKQISSIAEAFEEGEQLLSEGFIDEAISAFDRCLHRDSCYAAALEGKAAAYERLGKSDKAKELLSLAESVRVELWSQQVQADIRRTHPLFKKPTPYK